MLSIPCNFCAIIILIPVYNPAQPSNSLSKPTRTSLTEDWKNPFIIQRKTEMKKVQTFKGTKCTHYVNINIPAAQFDILGYLLQPRQRTH